MTVVNGHVTAIEWKDKKLAGSLDLSGFGLSKSRREPQQDLGYQCEQHPSLSQLNVSRNVLSSIDIEGCTALQDLKVYKNRLTDLNISGAPAITSINCSGNLLVELNVANSSTLKTLNCQSCNLEALYVNDCTNLTPTSTAVTTSSRA